MSGPSPSSSSGTSCAAYATAIAGPTRSPALCWSFSFEKQDEKGLLLYDYFANKLFRIGPQTGVDVVAFGGLDDLGADH